MKGQYLRRGLRLKSVPTTFRQLAEMPGSRCRTRTLSKFTLTRTVLSEPKLAAFEFKKWHVLIMIDDKLTRTMVLIPSQY
ncbi:hypothetical protein C1S45_02000 [Lactiplantibacillus plantarum]|nr:hypothetical protein DA080_00640 [Lactiplantibacillus plantarum]AVW06329.1 hypothetical protein DA076_00600 [Lactiplantibacillus plantarum]MCT0195093.1 hypothetical protein [Lactiplantibacillus plantarum]MCT1242015.1 hypothetical protein [Lactiplantibacillus plantarum]MCT3274427.1 hypothetical protein [Lactiplantibacillus plantarum]